MSHMCCVPAHQVVASGGALEAGQAPAKPADQAPVAPAAAAGTLQASDAVHMSHTFHHPT